ncbi:uncharacterized protein PHALS_06326 [Plasmopara halstedii]|uniref:Uncharacterized protein n=1 Tax=Plasmopara halstedii TaxID=4781 RepID=A0A0N7L802_PLAHL|nr:uncharacterized protein PHALS_06326 [Plasmopara halstedii]CEG48507.1 hypothetical protein PHALS_06326 [Plasmopara halstedii]|eukprot:XP_024584876.1 hypothetical protein PHALS_06326 [Plasmopara halstedii]
MEWTSFTVSISSVLSLPEEVKSPWNMRSRRSLGLIGVFAAGSEPRSGDPDFVIATGAGSGSNYVIGSKDVSGSTDAICLDAFDRFAILL